MWSPILRCKPLILESKELSAPFYQRRRAALQEKIVHAGLDALLVTHPVNIRYLAGFTGTSATVLVTPDGFDFLTDFRYRGQAFDQVSDAVIHEYRDPMKTIAKLLSERNVKTLGFEAEKVSVAKAKEMKEKFSGVKLEDTLQMCEEVRLRKDEPEIEATKRLAGMLAEVYPRTVELIRPGAVERDVALELEYLLQKAGADGPAFDFIVASGERSALPHGVASSKKISAGDMTTLDWGAKGWGYHTDNTRSIAVTSVNDEMKNVYSIVLEANLAGIDAVKPGVRVNDIDKVVRDIVVEAGYGEAFGHGTGHGVGLDIHEKPSVSWRDNTVLEEGMIITIEPGIYLSGKGGVRIEDLVLVTAGSCEVLTSAVPKEFMIY